MQVESIASMFELDPNRPVWIVKRSGNIAVFPRGGIFSGPLVSPGAVYDVKGNPLNAESHNPTIDVEVAGLTPLLPLERTPPLHTLGNLLSKSQCSVIPIRP